MKFGKMLKPGDVVLTKVQFTDTFEIKTRPAVILFEELDNLVVAGITSNPKMKGIPLTTKEGAVRNSVIKLNYLFTISKSMISRTLFHLTANKKRLIFKELINRLKVLGV